MWKPHRLMERAKSSTSNVETTQIDGKSKELYIECGNHTDLWTEQRALHQILKTTLIDGKSKELYIV